MKRTSPALWHVLLCVGLIGMTMAAVPVAAQPPSPSAGAIDGMPAYLQQGTCGDPGKVVLPLALVSMRDVAATPSAGASSSASDMNSTDETVPAAVSVTRLDRSLDALANAGLIVRIGRDTDHPADTIACAAIAGTPDRDGNLYLGVSPVGDNGAPGVVWLRREDDGHTTVTLFLIGTPAS